jgi:hypothetical protein
MAVTANQVIKMRGPARRRKVPVAASTTLYEGTLCFEDAGGDFANAVVENGVFGGVVVKAVDNSTGGDATAGGFGAKFAEVYVSGDFLLPMDTTSLTAADIGKPVYGVDNYTVTETVTDLVPVGILVEIVSSSSAWISIHGVGQAEAGARAT